MKHPFEDEYLAFAEKCMTPEYFKILAADIKNNWSDSGSKILPGLRKIYRQKFGKGVG